MLFSTLLSVATAQESMVTVLHDDMDSLKVSFVVGRTITGETGICGERFATLTIDGYQPSMQVGRPELPLFSQLVEVPLCGGFEVRVSEAVYDTVDAPSLPLAPVQALRFKNDTTTHPLAIDRALYATDAFYGEPEALVESIGIARDRSLARLQFAPVRYNAVSRKLIVCRRATVTVAYRNADVDATRKMVARYYTPAFMPATNTLNNIYPKEVSSTAPVRYLIVSHPMFRDHLDAFVRWKRRKGFMVDVAYTDSAAMDTTATSIAAFVKQQYTDATAERPAPTYLLLVGDVQQIPPFNGTAASANHSTDLYYATWTTGDDVPDCYYGRFSAQNVSQLIPQIEKTLMYEQYTFADPTFLDRAVMVAGVDGGRANDNGYKYGDPSMDYAIINYINGGRGFQQVRYFKNNLSIVPSVTNLVMGSNRSDNSEFVRNCYSEGAALINYTAHGSPSGWATPSFNTSHVPEMTNYQKFGLMIGNCCQSNTYNIDEGFGEALLRRGDYCGAVGYIGASNNTYWTYDFYWSVGSRTSVGPNMSMAYNYNKLGAYDRLCHTHNESYSKWATTQGSVMMAGNLAVASHSGTDVQYYWEIYHLMGDPSVMPYLTQAYVMELAVQPVIARGTTTLQVEAVPYAYVAVTTAGSHALVASAFADGAGMATLQLPSDMAEGNYEVVASAQQYRVGFVNLQVKALAGDEPYVFAKKIEAAATLAAGTNTPLSVSVKNIGGSATSALLHFASDNPLLSFQNPDLAVATINAGETLELASAMVATLSQQIPDGTEVIITVTTTMGNSRTSEVSFPMVVKAPEISLAYSDAALSVLPNGSGTLEVTVSNYGHASLPASQLRLVSPTSLLTYTCLDAPSFAVAAGDKLTLHYSLHADSRIPAGIIVPLRVQLDGFYNNISDTVSVFTCAKTTETFEGGVWHSSGWQQGTYPWEFCSTVADGGSWSLRSCSTLGHNSSSDLSISYNVTQPDSVSFRYKVHSETNYDKFHFYIDNVDMLAASGSVDWESAAFLLTPGTHVFRFSYVKDQSVSDSIDCAWIDNIVLPRVTQPVTFLSEYPCRDSLYVHDGDTVNTSELTTGTFVTTTAAGVTMVDYTVSPAYDIDTVVVACDGYMVGDQEYTTSGNVVYNGSSIHGCDSVVRINLTVNHSVRDTIEVNTEERSYTWNGTLYVQPGVYEQRFAAANGCDSIVTLLLTLPVGIDAADGGAVRTVTIYPNPTQGIVHFSREVEKVSVYDVCGRLLLGACHVQELDLGNLPAGIYTVRMTLPEGSVTGRVLKQ